MLGSPRSPNRNPYQDYVFRHRWPVLRAFPREPDGQLYSHIVLQSERTAARDRSPSASCSSGAIASARSPERSSRWDPLVGVGPQHLASTVNISRRRGNCWVIVGRERIGPFRCSEGTSDCPDNFDRGCIDPEVGHSARAGSGRERRRLPDGEPSRLAGRLSQMVQHGSGI